jgi:uncharacterized Zn-binding protein involved in type VI secretion
MNHLAIVVGDITDHGGSVISGAKTFFIDNVAVAHIGCEVLCPLHGATRIATGQNHFVVEGHPVAIEGDLTSCGARLISQQQSCFRIDGQPAAMGVAAYSPSETESSTGKAFIQPLAAASAATTWTAPSDIIAMSASSSSALDVCRSATSITSCCKTVSTSPEACLIAKAGARGTAAQAPLLWTSPLAPRRLFWSNRHVPE